MKTVQLRRVIYKKIHLIFCSSQIARFHI